MNIDSIKKALPYLFQAKITPLIMGHHGTGKSTAVREFCEENGYEFVDLRLGSMDVGDLLGLPDFEKDEVGASIATSFMRPNWFPVDPKSKGIIFLDEINRARRDVLQAIFQLVLDRKMHDKPLPKNWHVVAAANPDTEQYTVTDISDSALLDRFCIIKVTSNYNDFLSYAETKGVNKKVMRFISAQPTMLRGNNKDFDLKMVQPSDRSWQKVSDLLEVGVEDAKILNELISGLVGIEASTAYMAFIENEEKPIEGEKVVKNYASVRDRIKDYSTVDNYRSDLLNETANAVLAYLDSVKGEVTPEEHDNVIQFAMDIPNDVAFPYLRKMINYKNIFLKMIENKELEKKMIGDIKKGKK